MNSPFDSTLPFVFVLIRVGCGGATWRLLVETAELPVEYPLDEVMIVAGDNVPDTIGFHPGPKLSFSRTSLCRRSSFDNIERF